MGRVKSIIVVFIIGVSASSTFGQVPNIDIIDTPTAITLPRASYSISIWGYNGGGILTKAVIGLHEQIYLGASFDIENAIGSERARMNIPGVIAKIKITDGWESNPFLIAIGYDSFYSGKNGKTTTNSNPFNRVVYGPYAAMTKPLFIGDMQLNLHLGVRTPIQPDVIPENTAMFVSFDFPIGMFVPMIEVERVYFDTNRLSEILLNAGFRFNIFDSLSVELDFMMAEGAETNRMLIIEYMDTF